MVKLLHIPQWLTVDIQQIAAPSPLPLSRWARGSRHQDG